MSIERRERDRLLMARAADGDLAAQRTVTRRLMRRVRKLAGSLLTDPFDVDDATQIALLEILGSAKAYRAHSVLEVWADRIARRAALRIVRDRRVRSLRTDAAQEPDQLAARHGSLPPPATPRAIQEYVRELPGDRSTLFMLRHVFEYTLDEIAELTGVPRNTVKGRLLRARHEVKRRIRRELLAGSANPVRLSGARDPKE